MSDGGAGRIRALDDATVRQIAAGEVVERPASVVKELVENALDADATRVSVAVENGGIDGVRVRDDGVGMTPAELEMAVQEHTTSKIADIGDLEAGVGTLGFRGEALHTIGAVSRLTVRSRPRDAEAAGAEIEVDGGDVGEVRPAGCPPGTVVEVEDLFHNTPARRKFLKTPATEFDHVNTVVTQYALANPSVAVSLDHDDREVFATEGRGSLESTVLSVYGREVAESMREVAAEPSGPLSAVEGLVSHPETNRSTREYLSTFVNGRYVTAGVLREAVLDAYGDQLAPDRYPFAVLFLDVPPDAVDVNVHPRKMEVRFDDEAGVKTAVEEAVRESLLAGGLVRSAAARGRSAPDETEVDPERPDAEAVGGAGTTHEAASGVDRGRPRRSRSPTSVESASESEGPTGGERSDAASGAESTAYAATEGDRTEAGASADSAAPETDASGSAESTESTGAGVDETPPEPRTVDPDGATEAPRPSSDAATETTETDRQTTFGGDAETPARRRPGRIRGPTEQRTLDGDDAAPAAAFDHLPRMRILGQLHGTYVVAETPDGLLLIDQHAADERVNYERLTEALSGETPTQALADPVELELTAREAALFEEYADALAQVGFHAGRTGERTVAVRTVPAVFDAALDPGLLRDVLSEFASEAAADGETVDAVADSLVADLACYPSVTGNTSLTEGSVVDLLEALDDCRNPYACPHGRPVLVEIDGDEIGDRFERDYPGHADRRSE